MSDKLKLILKILWIVSPFVMVIAPFATLYIKSLEIATKFFHFYMIASFLLIAGLLGIAFYEFQWDGDPGEGCRTIRTIIILVMVGFAFLGIGIDQPALEGVIGAAAVTMLLFIALYFFYLQFLSFTPNLLFFLVGVVTVVSFRVLPGFSGGEISDAVAAAFIAAVASYAITCLIDKFFG